MDVNKNWVDWQIFDANASFQYIASRRNQSSLTCSAPKSGLYIVAMAYWGNNPILTTQGSTAILISGQASNALSKYYLAYVNCNAGVSMTISCTLSASYSQIAVFYFGSRYSNAVLQNYSPAGDNVAASQLVTTANNHVLIGVSAGVGPSVVGYSCTTQESYAEATFACGTTISSSGTIKMSLISNNYGSGVIGDILLS